MQTSLNTVSSEMNICIKNRYAMRTWSDIQYMHNEKFCTDPSSFYLKHEQYIQLNRYSAATLREMEMAA